MDNPTVLDNDAVTVSMWFNTTQETGSVRPSRVHPSIENRFSIPMDDGTLVLATGTEAGTVVPFLVGGMLLGTRRRRDTQARFILERLNTQGGPNLPRTPFPLRTVKNTKPLTYRILKDR